MKVINKGNNIYYAEVTKEELEHVKQLSNELDLDIDFEQKEFSFDLTKFEIPDMFKGFIKSML